MLRLDDLQLFVRAAALGSFSNAAREADLAPGQVSAAIQRMEAELQTRLFARSTRSLRLTAEGEQYLPFAQNALDTLRSGQEGLQQEHAPLRGVLQIAMPSDLGRNVLLPWLNDFARAHPALSLRLLLSDRVTDLFRDPVDLAFRYGRLEDASFVALPLAPQNRRVLVASPDYISRHGRPQSLDDLAQHEGLLYALQGRVYDQWVFHDTADGGKRRVVPMPARRFSDDADVVRRWAVAGEGLAYKSWLDLRADILAGRLEVLLPQVIGEAMPLQLVCPHRRQFSPAVRLLHAAMQAQCAAAMADLPLPHP